MRAFALACLALVAVAACETAGDPSIAPPEAASSKPAMLHPERFDVADRDACATAGGLYEGAGMLGYYRCTTQFTDGGATCADARDCQGKCLAGPNSEFRIGGDQQPAPQTGVCQATDNPFGCYSVLIDGIPEPAICVD